QKISISSRQLLALINDILDVSKLESGHQLAINLAPFEPEQVFHSVVSLHAYNLDEQQVELHVDISREVPHQLRGDAQRLEQVLGNLLGNAVKFTPTGDILLAVRVLERNNDEVTLEFSVSDSGIGISAHQQEQMFQPFVQADSSNTRQQGGTGLGLTISRQLCQLMGGELTLESVVDEGSTFRFNLPFEVLADESEIRSLIPVNKLLNMRVLAVDDNNIGRRILKNILTHMKFDVAVASCAIDALNAVRVADENGSPFGLLVIDYSMPEISGLEMVRLLTEQRLSQAPRILMVTASQKELLMHQAQDAEFNAIVGKPVQPSPLFDAIMQIFGYTATQTTPTITASDTHWNDVQLLLVEDHELNRQVARDLLAKVGINAAEAINGAVAVEMVRNHHYDMVLMDIQMPVMDGLEATHTIRQLDNCTIEQLPIVAMTANAFEQDRQESLDAGMNGHINKPIDPAKLYAELEHWLPQEKQVSLADEQSDDSPPSLLQQLATLPGLNIAQGLRYADGDQRRYYQLLQKFASSFAATATMLRHELTEEQHQQATIRVHTLKGIVATLGATELQEAATQLEAQLRNHQQPQALNKMLELLETLLAACANLPPLTDKTETSNDDLPTATTQQLGEILTQLVPALEKLQAKACAELATQLKQKRWTVEFTADIIQLQQWLERYRFTQALELVQDMQSKLQEGKTDV
ncbi:MAG: response regulator, partial [Thermodesulfobacteriota bacterium]|nr:response regulator [Thermodesulfobacteriota bacterium]